MTCSGVSERHDGLDPRAVRLGLSHVIQVRCAGCRSGIAAMGVMVRILERRAADVPVARDRRRFVPAWLRGLRAVDRTGELVRP